MIALTVSAAEESSSPPPATQIAGIHATQPTYSLTPASLLTTQRQMTFQVSDRVQFSFLLDAQQSNAEFAGTKGIWRPLNSISLRAGVGIGDSAATNTAMPGACLGTDSYLDCLSAVAPTQVYSVGASWQPVQNLTFSVDYHSREAEESEANRGAVTPLSIPLPSSASTTFLKPEHTSGIGESVDFSLGCDIDVGAWGDVELALQWTRFNESRPLKQASTLTDPYTATSLGLGWERGQFRGDLTSRYYDQANETRAQGTEWTTFDINFAWRTPWNARLSVGARNLLNNPAPNERGLSELPIDDVFGRVPYVRYQQDL